MATTTPTTIDPLLVAMPLPTTVDDIEVGVPYEIKCMDELKTIIEFAMRKQNAERDARAAADVMSVEELWERLEQCSCDGD